MADEVQFSPDAIELWSSLRERLAAAIADVEVCSDFERFSAFIQDAATLKAAFVFLKASRCELLPKPSPRTFLAALMVAHFPSEILEVDEQTLRQEAADVAAAAADTADTADTASAERTPAQEQAQLDVECMNASKAIVDCICDETTQVRDILVTLERFQTIFDAWKQHDRERLLRELGNTHHQWMRSLKHLEESRDESNHPESVDIMLQSVQRQIESNKRRILQLGGPDALETILSTPPQVIDLEELIREVGSKKFWSDFSAELRQTPPNYERIGQLLSEIRERLKALVPNNASRQQTIHTDIDVDFIRQVIHYGSFDGEAFLNVFLSIWRHIQSLQAAADDEEWTRWRDEVTEKAASGTVTWDVLLPDIFNKFLVRLDRIEEATRHFREQMNAHRETPTVLPAPSSS